MFQVLVFIGPSRSGKSTVVRRLHDLGRIEVTPSWTTRPRRADEVAGSVEHRFVSEEEFKDLEAANFFLGVVRPFGLEYRYGLPVVSCPGDVAVPAIMARATFVPLVDRHFPRRVVYQIEDSYDRASRRVVAAEVRSSGLGSRLAGHEEERRLGRQVADRVLVNATSVDDLVAGVAEAIDLDFPAERSHAR